MIYLDNQATTPTDSRVVDAMLPYFSNIFGNPHSTQHLAGAKAKDAVDRAREQVAVSCGASRDEIFFTSGATESNNLAIRGLAPSLRESGRTHVLFSSIEHKCVLAAVTELKEWGFHVEALPCSSTGVISGGAIARQLRPVTGLLCLMSANNEIGTLQPIAEASMLCRQHGVALHVDAAQSLGKEPIDLHNLGVTTASFSAHKLYGPKGIGAIFIDRRWRTRVKPQMLGGGQEGGIRSGTLPVPLCVGFGVACELAMSELSTDREKCLAARTAFVSTLESQNLDFRINGQLTQRLSGNLNIYIDGVDSEALIMSLRDEIAISSGSACTAASLEPSHVLKAIGLSDEEIECSIRVSFGRFTTTDDAINGAQRIAEAARQLRQIRH